ncbi:MAG: ATP-binding protein [Deltaproteobacteria bacterium]|nr:ATP-binding protein [Deltaproteobacteria bacterium]
MYEVKVRWVVGPDGIRRQVMETTRLAGIEKRADPTLGPCPYCGSDRAVMSGAGVRVSLKTCASEACWKADAEELALREARAEADKAKSGMLTRLARSGIPARYRTARMDDFSERVRRLIPPTGYDVFVSGLTGTGKTHLCAAIAYRAVESGIEPSWCYVPELLREIRGTFGGPSRRGEAREDDIVARLCAVPLLVLDDVGAQNDKTFGWEVVCSIVTKRLDWNRPTVSNSNLSLESIAAMDARLASRLAGGNVLELVGSDRRLSRLLNGR